MDELAQVLANTQEADTNVRVQAELAIKQAENNPAYPGLLTDIACSSSISTQIRQSALSALRRFIVHNWSQDDFDDDTPRIPISDEVKISTRQKLLELATGNDADRLVKAGVSYVVGKIASVDYPEQWPDLLPNLLAVIPTGTDVQLHGALRVLSEMVDGSLSEDQFFLMARQIVEVLYGVALNNDRKPQLRALAISIFRSSFDLMDMVKEDHLKEVKGFAEEALKGWLPFFHDVMKMPIPSRSPETQDQFNGVVALKLQVVKALIKIRGVFPSLLLPQSLAFFEETWAELNQLSGPYAELYIENDNQGRLENADGLPYTLDFLALEELDLLNQCMRASPVQKQLEAQLQAHSAAHETPWMIDLMKLTAAYARIIREEEDLWDIDVSLYLAEETSVTANYTARTACGDMLIKLGEWIGSQALEGLFAYTKTLFADGGDWRNQEAALYLFTMIINDFLDCEKQVPPQIAQAYMELVTFAIGRNEPLLQARGFLVAGILGQCYPEANVLLDRTILAITQAESELVQVACVKAVEGFTKSPNVPVDRQVQILQAVDAFLSSNDLSELDDADDLLVTLAETLRAAIRMNASIVITSDVKALDLLFLVAKHGATNFQITMLVNEAFEEIVQVLNSGDAYAALCSRVVPTLTGAFNVADLTQDEPLVTFATELISVLIEYGPEPLPAGLVAQLGPKLKRLLMESNEGEILRPGASALKFMLMHDHQQVFSWQDEQGHSGLEVCLHIIARLLNPAIEDNSASEVGGLAAELVEKAGHERLGNNLRDLLQAVATRLASAEAAPFIQSLILVFARLCLNAASDVVEFLGQIDIGGHNGLQIVLSKWLENSINFTGYDEIRQNVIALSKLYSLNDPRIAQTQVKGDLIVPASDRIVTRSRSKQSTKAVSPLAMNPITDFFTPPPKDPDQYTIVAAPLKILKVLIEELLSAQGHMGAASSAAAGLAAAAEFDDEAGEEGAGDDDGWEDEPDTLDLALGGSKRDWLSQFESGTLRTRDDETQAYLTEFFLRAARENEAGFQDWYAQLSEEEKGKLNELAGQ